PRDAEAGRLGGPGTPRELPRAEGLARQDGVTRRVEQDVVDQVDVVAVSRAAPVGTFVPIGRRTPGAEQAARLRSLPQHEQAVSAPDLLAPRAAPAVADAPAPAHAARHPREVDPGEA